MRWKIRSRTARVWSLAAPEPGLPVIHGGRWDVRPSFSPEGDRIVARFFPATNIYSTLISDKQRAVLSSPRFKSEGGALWLRLRGASFGATSFRRARSHH